MRSRLGRHSWDSGDEEDEVLALGGDARHGVEWRRLMAVVGSGAAKNILPPNACAHVKPTPTAKSKAGIGFRGAGGDQIPNYGKKAFKVKLADGTVLNSTWQVAGVKRPLMSVGKMLEAGNKVHLDSSSPRVVLANGRTVALRRVGNVFLIDLWVREPGLGFTRRG